MNPPDDLYGTNESNNNPPAHLADPSQFTNNTQVNHGNINTGFNNVNNNTINGDRYQLLADWIINNPLATGKHYPNDTASLRQSQSSTSVTVVIPDDTPKQFDFGAVLWDALGNTAEWLTILHHLSEKSWTVPKHLNPISGKKSTETVPAPWGYRSFFDSGFLRMLMKYIDATATNKDQKLIQYYYAFRCLEWLFNKRSEGKSESVLKHMIMSIMQDIKSASQLFAQLQRLDNQHTNFGNRRFEYDRHDLTRLSMYNFHNALGCVPKPIQDVINKKNLTSQLNVINGTDDTTSQTKSTNKRKPTRSKFPAPRIAEFFDESRHIEKYSGSETPARYCRKYQAGTCGKHYTKCNYLHRCEWCGKIGHRGKDCTHKPQ